MATLRTFQDMLNQYLPNELLRDEFIKRDYVLQKVEKDDGWLGGDLIVPFEGASASSVSFGGLTDETDISEDVLIRGVVSGQKEVWGSMQFKHRDLMEHNKVSEKNFLKLLPGSIERFMDYMKNITSMNLLNGSHLVKTTALSTSAAGVLAVDRVERLVIGQKLYTNEGTPRVCYVKSIDMAASTCVVAVTRGGTARDFSTVNLASGSKLHVDGAQTAGNAFSSIRDALLSAANGGSTTLYGQTKTAYPYLQAYNVSGAGITNSTAAGNAGNIMENIFKALFNVRQIGKGQPSEVLMSYKNLTQCIRVIEASKGAYNVAPGSNKANQFGWTEIEIGSVKGAVKLVAVQEADDDVIFIMDWRGVRFHSNGFFKKRASPDGNEYYELRVPTGYTYIVDTCLFGDLIVTRPSTCGVIFGISYVL
jgi:hypothetical protein